LYLQPHRRLGLGLGQHLQLQAHLGHQLPLLALDLLQLAELGLL
jgi:hypothetical protein